MIRRWLHKVAFAIVLLTVWLIAHPAHAAAPLCDRRGATTFAPAPTLQAPQTSISTVDSTDNCFDSSNEIKSAAHQGRSPSPSPPPLRLDAILQTSLAVPHPIIRQVLPRAWFELGPPHLGVRMRMERPPR